jgi:hypothetical protein
VNPEDLVSQLLDELTPADMENAVRVHGIEHTASPTDCSRPAPQHMLTAVLNDPLLRAAISAAQETRGESLTRQGENDQFVSAALFDSRADDFLRRGYGRLC